MSNSIQCNGFQAAGMAAGIKKNQDMDLGMIYIPDTASAAAVFTRNQVQAAPVVISKSRLSGGRARAVIANSGNANCCTGDGGIADARAMVSAAADALGIDSQEVWVASTGVIGAPMPMETIRGAIPHAAGKLRPDGFEDFARAIMTTDTRPKLVRYTGEIGGREFTIIAVAKGAGMIRPDMATMLCFVCTDVEIPSISLQQGLTSTVNRTLNRISIDGDTSTNDMVLAMASGKSGVVVKTSEQFEVFETVMHDVLMDIARRLVKDGEGVNKVVEIKVQGAASNEAALKVVDTVAHSPLVKTAFFGEDANWGRIIMAVGRAGVPIDPLRVDLYFDDVMMCRHSQGCGADAEARSTAILKQSDFTVTVDLNQGSGQASMLTCDFSVDYVKINADYRS